jgi:hypothetical protein
MRIPAKILIAGTLAGTLPLLWCGAATSQTSTVVNDQVQLGDVFATQELNVVEPSDAVVGATTALGNSFGAFADGGRSMDVSSRQKLQGDVRASTTLNAEHGMGWDTVVTTTAHGNSGMATATGGGSVSGSFKQKAGDVMVRAGTGVFGEWAWTGNISASAQTAVNNQALHADNGNVDATVVQNSAATTEAATGVIIRHINETGSFASSAVNNTLSATGAGGEMSLGVRQTATGDHTQATVFVSAGRVGTAGHAGSVSAASTAVANSVMAENNGGPMAVASRQANTSYVRAQTVNNADSFGASTTLAYGVGNSLTATEFGPELTLDNNQFNDGGVSSIAEAGGREGFDMSVQATAIGNAVTGTVCTTCGGVIDVNNRQVNRSNVVASTKVNLTGANRNTAGVATAVGNTASFFATTPGE